MEIENDLKLEPCPFCGGEAVVLNKSYHYSKDSWGDDWYVECKGCRITSPTYETLVKRMKNGQLVIFKDGRTEAITKWNDRFKEEK